MSVCRVILAMSLASGIAGCTVGPNFVDPEMRIPAAFAFLRPDASDKSGADTAQAQRISSWWKTLHDPELNYLVERAVSASPDIEAALDRIQEAREREAAVLGLALPHVGAGGSYARGTGTDSVKSPRIPPTLDAAINTTGFQEVTGVVGFDAGWELDLFGKYRRALEAVRYDTLSAFEARNATLIRVVSEVARNYAVLRGLQLRVKIVKENVASAEDYVKLTLTRYKQGLAAEGDNLLAQRELEALNSTIPPLNSAIFDAVSRIALLLGTYSGDVSAKLQKPGILPHTPERVKPGQPIELLRRRPDIREAEADLAAANALIGVAAADLFPRVSLTAGVGIQGGREIPGANPPVKGLIWSVGPGAYWPLLDFGQLDAAVKQAEYRTDEHFAGYRKTVITAVEEVNTSLMRYRSELEAAQHLSKAVEASRRALNFHTGRYKSGISDFLNVLDAARQEYALEERYAIARLAVVVAYIALYKALGGGWELYQEVPPIAKPLPAVVAAFQVPVLTQIRLPPADGL